MLYIGKHYFHALLSFSEHKDEKHVTFGECSWFSVALCSVSNICDLMTNDMDGSRRKRRIFNAAGSRSLRQRRGAVKCAKFLLKTAAKQRWLIDSDEAGSRSIHHTQHTTNTQPTHTQRASASSSLLPPGDHGTKLLLLNPIITICDVTSHAPQVTFDPYP